MPVIVTKMPGGITQLFNTETGKVTYKCKSESGYMMIESFGGIVKFNQKGATATITGNLTSIESCSIIKENDPQYKEALIKIISAQKQYSNDMSEINHKKIQELERKLDSI